VALSSAIMIYFVFSCDVIKFDKNKNFTGFTTKPMREAAMPPKFTARFVNSLTSSEINFTKILRAASMGADQGSSKR